VGVGGKHLVKKYRKNRKKLENRVSDACEKPQQAQRTIFTQFAM